MNKVKVGTKKLTVNGITPARERAILRADAEARAGKNIVGPFTVEEFKKIIDSM